ncbi:hypothetical protein B0H19DRAFT_1368941 [Mycena capillaripes]|nr:hypothetical protein B0H19DRAFT_1368941 [Mycena capillaripes]
MSNTKLHVLNALDAHFQDVVLAVSITSIVLAASLLLAIAYAAWNPVSRHQLNRVSFRLLVCALIANLIFTASSIPAFSGPSAGCSFTAFCGLSTLMFPACMFFCTGLNLQLVLVHHVNGNSMEKFYYIGSVTIVAILNIPPYAAGQFGYYNGVCGFSNPHPDVQFRWLFWSQAVWILLMSTGEVVSFFWIIRYMYRIHSLRKKVWSTSSFGPIPNPPIVAYRTVILRIGLYSLLSCCLNFTGSILNIWMTKNPVPTELQRRLLFLDLCIFSLRPILYTLLAAADPSFLRAMRALRRHSKSTDSTDPTSGIKSTSSHRMKRLSVNSRALVHVQMEQAKHSTTWAAGSDRPRLEQGVASNCDAEAVMGNSFFLDQELDQSGVSETELEQEREAEEELGVEGQRQSMTEDIPCQI